MDNWAGIFALVIFIMVANLGIAFVVLRGLASAIGVSKELNTSKEALHTLLTIVPVAGVAGAPFIILPFIGPFFALFISSCVAPMMLTKRYELTQGDAAKVILPVIAVIYIATAAILYLALPMVL
jgi:hypothetical protein